ncbi:MAG: pyridoxal phosphate-dependent aminotransferase [Candidatus Aenigmatarchaeota archaeon]|nr:MAG: pyridoxal phosphate-dependent aminotransferase [Candidatus Aenigmarchaeota archaeon]
MRRILAERGEELPRCVMGRLLSIIERERDVISLGPGEPDFRPPERLLERIDYWLKKGETRYSPPEGREELREAISRKLKKENGIDVGPEQVVVTAGSTEAILLALMVLIDPGEGVLIPDPSFLTYRPTVELISGMPLLVPLSFDRDWQFDVDEAKKAILPEKTNAIIINTPNNPTGTVYSRKTLEEIADFANEYDLIIISDEAYEKFVYGDFRHISPASLNGMEDRVITLHSCSKTLAMPGLRVGWASGPEKLIKAMVKIHLFSSLSASTPVQLAVAECLEDNSFIQGWVREYGKRRQMVMEWLDKEGLEYRKPGGAFYLFPRISRFGLSSFDFAKQALEKARVAVVPGTEFGKRGEGFIRISYATSPELIEKGLERLSGFLRSLGQ